MKTIIIIMVALMVCFALFTPFIISLLEGNRMDRLADKCFGESTNYESKKLCYCALIKYSQEYTKYMQMEDTIGICSLYESFN